MSQVDEGLIHAWLDGQLSPDEAARVERLVATDPTWSAAAADARGLLAGASRVLGALDGVPALGGGAGELAGRAGERARGRAGRRISLWRVPLVRAAAGIVLVAGVGGLLWQRIPQQPSYLAAADKRAADSVSIAAPPVIVPTPPAVQRELQSTRRNESAIAAPAPHAALADAERHQANARTSDSAANNTVGGATPRPSLPPTLAAPPIAAMQGAAAPANVAAKVAGALRDALADQPAPAALLAPQIAGLHLDGCWALTDSAGRVLERDGMVLHFISPAASDIGSAAAPQTPLPRQASAKEQLAPVGARLMNAVVSQRADSMLTSTWFTDRGTTTALFTVRGDTLRGTTRLSAGDVAYPLQLLRAVRVTCPPAR